MSRQIKQYKMVRNSGILDEKKKLLVDVSLAFEGNRYCDVTFTLADGKSISTSKFMLACRVPYFDKLLFGGSQQIIG